MKKALLNIRGAFSLYKNIKHHIFHFNWKKFKKKQYKLFENGLKYSNGLPPKIRDVTLIGSIIKI